MLLTAKRLQFCPLMRTLIKNCVLAVVLAFILTGCTKTATSVKTYIVTENDAASIIANNLLPQYGGFVNEINQGSLLWGTSARNCGISKDTIFNGTNTASATVTYKYAIPWHYANDCQGLVNATLDGKLNYEGANYIGEATLNSALQISPATKPPFINLIGSAALTGMQRIKGQSNAAFNTFINLNDINLIADGVARKIISGTSNVSITCTNGAASFSFKGTIQFIGYNKAKITLDSSTTYPISW